MDERQRSIGIMNFEIPEGLTDLLQDFTVAVLRERPHPNDLIDFAANYFAKLQEGNRKSENKRGVTFSEPANDDEESDIEEPPGSKRYDSAQIA